MKKNLLNTYANHFYQLGCNVTCISDTRNEFNLLDKNILKAPNHKWKHLIEERQTLSELDSYNWNEATGIGIVLGFENTFALDIDGCIEFDLIKLLCEKLKLPSDYEWIVKSGSGCGYHIIFKCDNVIFDTSNELSDIERYKDHSADFGHPKIDVNAYYPRKYGYKLSPYEYDYSKNDDEETYDNYIGNVHKNRGAFRRLMGNDLLIEDCFKKIEFCWRCNLVIPPSLHQTGNEYSFMYSIPINKPRLINFDNLKEIYHLFCSRRAEGSYDGHVEIASEDKAQFDMEPLKIRWNTKPTYLFFDITSNGLPKNTKEEASTSSNWPKLIQLSWSIGDQSGNQIKRESFIISPSNFIFEEESKLIHGISDEIASNIGYDLKYVLEKFLKDIEMVEFVITHNYEFNSKVLLSEMLRLKMNTNFLKDKKNVCLMQLSTEYCEIENEYGNKYPTLSELYFKLFNRHIHAGQNAGYDLTAIEVCFYKLKREGVISLSYKSWLYDR